MMLTEEAQIYPLLSVSDLSTSPFLLTLRLEWNHAKLQPQACYA